MCNWKKYSKFISLKGKNYSSQDIFNYAEKSSGHFEKSIFDFLKQWFSDEDHIIQKTSGTTGKPREIKLSKNLMAFSAMNTGNFFRLQGNDKCFLCLPADHIAGKMMLVRSIVHHLDLWYEEPSARPIPDQQYAFSAMTPMQVENIIADDKKALNNIKTLIIGGAPVGKNLLNIIQDVESEIWETYGMTETASHIALRKLNGHDRSDHFTVLDGISIKTNHQSQLIVSIEAMNILDLVTNDIAELYGDTEFRWLGRTDNVINSGGKKLQAEEIEKKLKSVFTQEFFIFPIKHPVYHEVPAIVFESSPFDPGDVFVKILEKYEIPSKVFFVDKFIRTASNKINRNSTISMIDTGRFIE
jgi:O-succinylbenzoic acid--CoA ligase